MQVSLSYVYRTDSPSDWRTRECFHFQEVEKIEISDYNEFKNQEVIISSKVFPMITYKDGDCFRCRYATEEELKDYCQIKDDKFIFHQVQRDCIGLGKGIWD